MVQSKSPEMRRNRLTENEFLVGLGRVSRILNQHLCTLFALEALADLTVRHSACNQFHRYALSRTQRCWTYRSHTAHAHALPPYEGVTDIVGSVACGHWLV